MLLLLQLLKRVATDAGHCTTHDDLYRQDTSRVFLPVPALLSPWEQLVPSQPLLI